MFTFCSFTSFFGTMLGTLAGAARRDLARKKKNVKNVIVCRTHDEVNAELARLWCDEHGLDFQPADERDDLFPTGASALAIDLNYLARGPAERAQIVERLYHALPPYPVAVASYDLDSEVKGALQARGLLVFRRIDRQLFYELAAAMDYEFAHFVA